MIMTVLADIRRNIVLCMLCFLLSMVRAVASDLPDLSEGGPYDAGQEYRLSITGLIGTVEDGYVLVTGVKPKSPLDGRALPGDRLIRVQGSGLANDLSSMMRRHMLRLWRENDGRLRLTFARPGEAGGDESVFSVHMHLPAPPGTIQHFGPIGIFASMYADHVEITRIKDGSPADGILAVGDRIVAIGGKPVRGDLYQLFADQIELAESEAQNGQLNLRVLRPALEDEAPESFEKTLRLPALGSRSITSPADCPKVDALITRAADIIVETGKDDRMNIELLGLLATGNETYIEYVGARLREADFARPDLELSLATPMVSWAWSYRLITLCEYYLLTGDEYVLPAIRTYARTIAHGQDVAGLWNHRMANPEANRGHYNARLYGYGAINQTSAVLWIGLILAEKCGVDDPVIRTAIDKTRALYGNWAGRGALPYGNHAPMEHILTSNGTSGSVAVGFALLGDADAARFYGQLSAASHPEIFTGHTGPFFNYFWSGLGANVLGPDVWAAYERQIGWLRTFSRTWDGRFLHMEQRGDIFQYRDLHSTGPNLLNMASGRRVLHITGKGMDEGLWLRGDAALAAVERPVPDTEMATAALIELLGHTLPPVRLEAAGALVEQEAEVGESLLTILLEGSREQRIGALHALQNGRVEGTLETLMAIIRDESEDLWVRQLAIRELAQVDTKKIYLEELMHLLLREKPYDAFQDLDRAIGQTLVTMLQPDPFAHDLDGDLFYAGILRLLDHPHMWARNAGMRLLQNMPLEDFHRVADTVIHVIRDEDLTYTLYHGDGPRQGGLDLMNRLQIEEVLTLALETIHEPTGRPGPRIRNRTRLIRSFGREAEEIIPMIREKFGEEDAAAIIASIRESEIEREMIPLADVME